VANDHTEAARVFHDATKHSYTSVRAAPHFLDWENKPLPYKIYPEAGALALPRDLSLPAMPALEAIAGSGSADDKVPLDLGSLTRILFCAAGITRVKRVGGEDYHFRAAPSAGALYPIEAYVAAGGVDGLEAALYHFSPGDLELRGLRRGDWRTTIARAAAMRPSLLEARAVVVLSAIFWRSAWKYRARAYRYCFWDGGTILANMLAAAYAEGLPAEIVTAFVDSEIERLVGIDGEREGLVCLVALGRTASASGEQREVPPLALETVPLSAKETAYEDLATIHRESRLVSLEEVRAVATARVQARGGPSKADEQAAGPQALSPTASLALGETVLRRGSTRAFARESISAVELATVMAVSRLHPRADFPRLTDTYLVVNAVDGMEPGAYHYRRESGTFELLKAGDFRAEAGYLCLEQELGADCSALVIYMAELERVLGALGNRAYRDAHLEAGLMGGRAYLAAYAINRGATGLTFYDDDTTKFFEPHAVGRSPLLMVAVGVPLSKASGHSE
jgi:SagB-type dehydrogenase family enzyme